jgi:hypothetical protein
MFHEIASFHLNLASDPSDQIISAHFCGTELAFSDPPFRFFNYSMLTAQKPTYCTQIPLHHILGSLSGYAAPL